MFFLPIFFLLFGCADQNAHSVKEQLANNTLSTEDVNGSVSSENLGDNSQSPYVHNNISISSVNNSCGNGESFSLTDFSCSVTYSCDSEFECINIGNILAEEIAELFSLTSYLNIDYDIYNEETELQTFDVYANLLKTDYFSSIENMNTYSDFWSDFSWIIPSKYRLDITKFRVYEGSWMQAYMLMHDLDSANEWTFAVNSLGFTSAKSTVETYVHEFSHVLSLRKTQIDYYSDSDSCDGVYFDDVCVIKGSYLYDFYESFYLNDPYPNNDLFFVSSYASNNTLEDFSESFMHFVFEPTPDSDSIRDDKVLFFYNYPEFIEMRNEILSRVIIWIPKSNFFLSE